MRSAAAGQPTHFFVRHKPHQHPKRSFEKITPKVPSFGVPLGKERKGREREGLNLVPSGAVQIFKRPNHEDPGSLQILSVASVSFLFRDLGAILHMSFGFFFSFPLFYNMAYEGVSSLPLPKAFFFISQSRHLPPSSPYPPALMLPLGSLCSSSVWKNLLFSDHLICMPYIFGGRKTL